MSWNYIFSFKMLNYKTNPWFIFKKINQLVEKNYEPFCFFSRCLNKLTIHFLFVTFFIRWWRSNCIRSKSILFAVWKIIHRKSSWYLDKIYQKLSIFLHSFSFNFNFFILNFNFPSSSEWMTSKLLYGRNIQQNTSTSKCLFSILF
jgi:hypothetical protein